MKERKINKIRLKENNLGLSSSYRLQKQKRLFKMYRIINRIYVYLLIKKIIIKRKLQNKLTKKIIIYNLVKIALEDKDLDFLFQRITILKTGLKLKLKYQLSIKNQKQLKFFFIKYIKPNLIDIQNNLKISARLKIFIRMWRRKSGYIIKSTFFIKNKKNKYDNLKIDDFFITKLGLNYLNRITNDSKYLDLFKLNVTDDIIKNHPIILAYLCLKNVRSIYLYHRLMSFSQASVQFYWEKYFSYTTHNVLITEIKRFGKFFFKKSREKKKKFQSISWKRGMSWINQLVLKRRLYKTRSHKLNIIKHPLQFHTTKFYKRLWYTNYDIRQPKRILYKWNYQKYLLLKSLRAYFGRLSKGLLLKIFMLVDRRVSIYSNRYDQFLAQLENRMSNQAISNGLVYTSFWSRQWFKNGWVTANNPDNNFIEADNYLFKIKKNLFPLGLIDPKNLYYSDYFKTYKFEQYRNLIMPERKNNIVIKEGSIINFIFPTTYFRNKFNVKKGEKFIPNNPSLLFGETFSHNINKYTKAPLLKRNEIYNSAVLIFNPRLQDLSLSKRINSEIILFTFKNIR